MLPPDTIPPGVAISKDQSTIQTPLTIYEWMKGHLADARKIKGCKEGICQPGELVYVPAGWYHLVLNLEPSLAITQNFVTKRYLPDTLGFMKYKPDQVSGFDHDVLDPYETFVSRLGDKHPEVLAEALELMEKRYGPKKRKWDELTRGLDEETMSLEKKVNNGCGFSFGFASDASDEEIP